MLELPQGNVLILSLGDWQQAREVYVLCLGNKQLVQNST